MMVKMGDYFTKNVLGMLKEGRYLPDQVCHGPVRERILEESFAILHRDLYNRLDRFEN